MVQALEENKQIIVIILKVIFIYEVVLYISLLLRKQTELTENLFVCSAVVMSSQHRSCVKNKILSGTWEQICLLSL